MLPFVLFLKDSAIRLRGNWTRPIAHITPSRAPRINGPSVIGATPGKPFLYLIPATGDAPLSFKAEPLPAGLQLDAQRGIISGAVEQAGDYCVWLSVVNSHGAAKRRLNISAGEDKLALT